MQIKIDILANFPTFLLMKAYKKSISFPAKMGEWVENEAQKSRRSVSSLVQEAMENLIKINEKFGEDLGKQSTRLGLSQSDLIEAALLHFIRSCDAKNGKTVLPIGLEEIVETMQKERGKY